MSDWLIIGLAQLQGGIVKTLAAELRAGGIATAWLAFGLGALHALTPGHGKAALAAYMLGHEARIGKGLRIALAAALLHVVSGFAVFLVFRFVIAKSPLLLGRPSPSFTAIGYGLIALAGLMMVVQSVRGSHAHRHGDGSHAITAGIGLLPCPLTISVLGFAWSQSNLAMVGLVLVSLGLGISLTIGVVALVAIIARQSMGAALCGRLPALARWSRGVQGAAGALIMLIGLYTIWMLEL
jgi:ABC-type nickel/cobalt efflux system permease component RcnA